MNRLTNTKLLILLSSKGVFNSKEINIKPLYDDFAHSVISLCKVMEGDIPVEFTLHSTRLELESHQYRFSIEGAEENILIQSCIARCLAFIDVALQWNNKPAIEEQSLYLFVRYNQGFKKITADAISYLQAASSYCEIHLTNDTVMLVSIPLSEVIKYLQSDNFIRIHRSFSVNLLHVDSFIGNTLIMDGEIKLPIGREYRNQVIGKFTLIGTKSRKYIP